MKVKTTLGVAGLMAASLVYGSAAEMIAGYRQAGAGPFSAGTGGAAWMQEYPAANGVQARSCASCHGTDITRPGRHIKTGKRIEAMAVSANPTRLSDPDKVEKWFRRNCRWTLGRECTSQEKGDFIQFITAQ